MRLHVVIRRLFIACLSIALVVVAARCLAIQGWIIPARVTSGSMAGSLLGEHFLVKCGECEYPFPCGVESKPRDDAAVCPNCGWNGNKVRSELRVRGQRVLIDRGAYWLKSPARFDVVAFYDPARPSRLVVKRVVGLPGEQIAIRGGDLYINGEMVHKSLAEFRTSAALVHDNDHLAHHGSEFLSRWKPEMAESGWETNGNEFRWNPALGTQIETGSDSPPKEVSLVYHHWRCYANPHPRSQAAPISDNSGYNQGESRSLQDVTDVVFSCAIRIRGTGRMAVRIHDGREWLTLWLEPAGRRAQVKRGENTIATALFPKECPSDQFNLEFGLLDQQIVLALNSSEVLRQVYEPSAGSRRAIPQPLAIRCESLNASIQRLVIKRDVYYLDPANIGQPWQLSNAVDKDSFFVLGDNPSLSEDSRHWTSPFIRQSAIRGQVIPWR